MRINYSLLYEKESEDSALARVTSFLLNSIILNLNFIRFSLSGRLARRLFLELYICDLILLGYFLQNMFVCLIYVLILFLYNFYFGLIFLIQIYLFGLFLLNILFFNIIPLYFIHLINIQLNRSFHLLDFLINFELIDLLLNQIKLILILSFRL